MPAETHGYNVRALDGTLVKEPGSSGSLWRIHYSVRIPSLVCDHFELTSTKGAGTGEVSGAICRRPGRSSAGGPRFCKPSGVEALTRQGRCRDGAAEQLESAAVEPKTVTDLRWPNRSEICRRPARSANGRFGQGAQGPHRRSAVCDSKKRGGRGAGAPPDRKEGATRRPEAEAPRRCNTPAI